MEIREFYDKVNEHDDLEGLGVTGDEVVIKHLSSGVIHALKIHEIPKNKWEELEGVLTGKRASILMIQLTRIVGYYSRVNNWNKSAIEQLKARHKGKYTVEEPE